MEEFFNFNEEVADSTSSKDNNFLSLFQRFNRLTKRKIKDLYVDNIPDQSIKKMKPICTYEWDMYLWTILWQWIYLPSVCSLSIVVYLSFYVLLEYAYMYFFMYYYTWALSIEQMFITLLSCWPTTCPEPSCIFYSSPRTQRIF